MTITVSGNYVVSAGQDLTFDGNAGAAYTLTAPVSSPYTPPSLTDLGSIQVNSTLMNASVIGVTDDGPFSGKTVTIGPTGSLTVSATGVGSTAFGYSPSPYGVSDFENDGVVNVAAMQIATGATPSHGFTNTGSFTVSADSAIGVSHATVFHNTGSILVSGGSAAQGLFLDTAATTASITNSGSIAATVSRGAAAYGIAAFALGSTATIDNSGTITAPVAIQGFQPGNASGTTLTINNSGTINGLIKLLGASDHIVNTGTINGDISEGGNATLDSHAGVIHGSITIGGGGLTASLGAEDNTVFVGATVIGLNAYVIDGGGGVNTLSFAPATAGVNMALGGTFTHFQNIVGSSHADILQGDAGPNVINGGGNDGIGGLGGIGGIGGFSGNSDTMSYANAGAGVIVSLALQGSAQYTGGGGVDTLNLIQNLTGSNYNDVLIGDANNNTLVGGLGADVFVVTPGGGNDTIADFSHAQGDRIDVSAFNLVPGTTVLLAQSGPNVVVSLGSQTLTLLNVQLGSLTYTDFGLGPTGLIPTSPPPGMPLMAPAGGGTLTGGAGNDTLIGGAGADTLYGGGGTNTLNGGGGVNTAQFDGPSRSYTVAVNASVGTVSGGPEGASDTLAGIQRVNFVDGYLATSTTDSAGQVYRVYEATLNRAPDQQGLANWVHAMNGGTSLQTVINGFVNSTEFQQTYGALTDTAFVTLLYNNVLHRAPDAGGLANWLSYLQAGHSRAEVVTGFSESTEDVNALAAPVQQGLWIEDVAAGQVARLYDAVFGRLPDAGGLANWTHNLENGTSLQAVANGFVASAEFQTKYGALDPTAFVTLLYNNVLHRAPDAGGLANWVGQLNAGHSRAEVVVGFSESAEHIQNTAAHVDSGIWLS